MYNENVISCFNNESSGGTFMGLFDKKYCDICGKEIKLLGNRKLDDGNMCKDCASKLSPWFQGPAILVLYPSANAGVVRDTGSVLGLGRFPGGGNGNPLWYSCLENPMDRGDWQVTIHTVAGSQTQPKQLSALNPCS